MFPLPLEDEPARRLGEEDDDDQADTTDAADAHDEVGVRAGVSGQNVTNETA